MDVTVSHIIVGIIVGAILGGLVSLIGSLLDPNPNNTYAKIAGFVVFLLVVLAYLGLV